MKGLSLSSDESLILEKIEKDEIFLEALYLASPVLYEQYRKYILGMINSEKEISKLKTIYL